MLAQDIAMDWIERLFGVNLDGGDGSTEALIVFTCVFLLTAAVAVRAPVFRERVRLMEWSWRMRS